MRPIRILAIACCLLGCRLFADDSAPAIPDEMVPRVEQARELADGGDYAGAEQIYRDLLGFEQDNLYLLECLGGILNREEKYEEAETVLMKAVALGPGEVFTQRTLGYVYWREGKYDQAEVCLKKAIEIEADDIPAHDYLGKVKVQQGQWDAAQKEFETVAVLDLQSSDAVFNLAVFFAFKMSPDKEKAGDYYKQAREKGMPQDKEFEEEFSKLEDAKVDDPPQLQWAAARKQFENGEYVAAEKTYRRLLESTPEDSILLSDLGVTLFHEHRCEEAEVVIKKVVTLAPGDEFDKCLLGIVYYTMGQYDQAKTQLTATISLNEKDATAHNYLGITMSQKGQQEVAQKELETAVELDPKYADGHFNLAVVLVTKQPIDVVKSRQHYWKALELGAERDAALEGLIAGSESAKANGVVEPDVLEHKQAPPATAE